MALVNVGIYPFKVIEQFYTKEGGGVHLKSIINHKPDKLTKKHRIESLQDSDYSLTINHLQCTPYRCYL